MGRLVIVSNRLPFSVQRGSAGAELGEPSGGLIAALSSYLRRRSEEDPSFECIWVGWPGVEVPAEEQAPLRASAMRDRGAYPVFLDTTEIDAFYHGFCNGTLWPVFHYFASYAVYREKEWAGYQRANQRFCSAVLEVARPDDEIWVHDYQLLLLPRMLRTTLPQTSIGFFLHIPFPSFEVFRQLPTRWRRDLLQGVLGADVIGFNTHDYVQHFLHSVFRTLGHEHYLGQITVAGELRRVESFPVGVDFQGFWDACDSPEVTAERATIIRSLRDRVALLSVDQLDYSKGLLHRLRGLETFLDGHPEWVRRLVLLMVVVPSREHVRHYEAMKSKLDELVGRINGKYGSVDWSPIIYQYRAVTFSELVALYSAAPIALVTPLRDGMNLIAKGFLASKPDGRGVLILSEMAGAARELGEAVQINPNHRLEFSDAILEALQMPEAEQIARNRPMQERLRTYDAEHWAESFMAALRRTKARQGKLATLHLTGDTCRSMIEQFREAKQRVILLDYDGTLVPFAPQPHLAAPDPELLELLDALQASPKQTVCLVSGRDRGTLERWFSGLPIQIIAEHGAWVRNPNGDWRLLQPLRFEWKDQLRPLVQLYVDRVPGSLLEEKDFSLAWHYRLADAELGTLRAKELMDEIVLYTANLDLQVLEGKKVLEIRNAGVNKGAAALHLLAQSAADFVLAAGDDLTDEELFRALPSSAVTVRVGSIHSHASFHVHDHLELRHLLRRLLEATHESADTT